MDRPCAAFWLLMASLASPALAAETGEEAPPWAVEAPGAAGARFGLGLDLFFEHQESLRIIFQEQTLRSLDPLTGNEESSVLRTDPGLLNRKFDLEWDLTGLGIQPAIALPLPRTLGLHPTVVLQAASADVSLDFLDRNQRADSSSLDGRGSLFGAGLDLTRAFCEGCPWFAGVSYFSQRIPGFTVDRAPPFGLEGFEILDDEVQLRRDVQEVSTRVGYGFSGNRIVSYVGVRHLRTDVEIEDRLRYRDPFLVETSLSSRTKLESEVTLASAGVEARLGPRLFGRLETSVGEEDWGAFLRVVYLGQEREKEPDYRLTERDAETARRLHAISAEITYRIAEIWDEFLEDSNHLDEVKGPEGQPAYEVRQLEELFGDTEAEILAVLRMYPELEALGDWIQDEFRRARSLAGIEPQATEAVVAALGLPFLHGRDELQSPQAGGATRSKNQGQRAIRSALQTQKTLGQAISRGLSVQVMLITSRERSLRIFPRRNQAKTLVLPPGMKTIGVGSYSWEFFYGSRRWFNCDGNRPAPPGECPLDLIADPCVVIMCGDVSCKQMPWQGACR